MHIHCDLKVLLKRRHGLHSKKEKKKHTMATQYIYNNNNNKLQYIQ